MLYAGRPAGRSRRSTMICGPLRAPASRTARRSGLPGQRSARRHRSGHRAGGRRSGPGSEAPASPSRTSGARPRTSPASPRAPRSSARTMSEMPFDQGNVKANRPQHRDAGADTWGERRDLNPCRARTGRRLIRHFAGSQSISSAPAGSPLLTLSACPRGPRHQAIGSPSPPLPGRGVRPRATRLIHSGMGRPSRVCVICTSLAAAISDLVGRRLRSSCAWSVDILPSSSRSTPVGARSVSSSIPPHPG